ncbi:MAG: ABC transporter permease, partial [bacterium]
ASGITLNEVILNDGLATFTWSNLKFLLMAIGFGVMTGILSGAYPAWKASRIDPAEVLRYG